MTTDIATPRAQYPLTGAGPYALTWPYQTGEMTVQVMVDGVVTELVEGTDYTLSPSSAASGNLFLLGAWLTATGTLYIDRSTRLEQGWVGTYPGEKGMEAALDRLTRHQQEMAARVNGGLHVGTAENLLPFAPVDGAAIIWLEGQFKAGPTADQIAAAQLHAASAQQIAAQFGDLAAASSGIEAAKTEAVSAANLASGDANSADIARIAAETARAGGEAAAVANRYFPSARAAVPSGVAVGDYYLTDHASDASKVALFRNVAGVATEIQATVAWLDQASNIRQLAAQLSPSVGATGTVLDFVARQGRRVDAASPAANVIAAPQTLATFARASATVERNGPGAFGAVASGALAYGLDASQMPMGLAIRPAATNLLGFSDDLSQTAFWLQGNATPSSDGANLIGNTRWRLTDNATSGTHSIRQTEAVTSGLAYTLVVDLQAGTMTNAAIALGAPFGNTLLRCDLSSGTMTLVSGTAPTASGMINLGGGVWRCWVTATAASTGTSSQWIYMHNGTGTTYAGTGGYIYIHHAQLMQSDVVVPPVRNTTSGNATRAADTLTLTDSGSRRSIVACVWSPDLLIPVGGTALSWTITGGASAVRAVNRAGRWTLELVSGGAVVASATGPALTTAVQKIAVAYDQVAGIARWSVDGQAQTALTGGPSSLTTICIGHDIGGGQVNAFVQRFEVIEGAGSQTALNVAAGGAAATVTWDREEIVILPSASAVVVAHPMPGGANDDYILRTWDFRSQLAYRAYGWARGSVVHAKRTGDLTFGPAIKTLVDANTANDDSFKVSGASANEFCAIMSAPSQHGFMEASAVTFSADGITFNPATALPMRARRFKAVQTAIALSPLTCLRGGAAVLLDATGKFADRVQEWTITAHGQLTYRSAWSFTASITMDSGSYLAMTQLVNDDAIWSLATYLEGEQAIVAGTTTACVTASPSMREIGATYEAQLTALSGWSAASTMFVQNSDASSAKHKIYARLSGTDIAFSAGQRAVQTFQETFAMRG